MTMLIITTYHVGYQPCGRWPYTIIPRRDADGWPTKYGKPVAMCTSYEAAGAALRLLSGLACRSS